eukprot:2497611-Pleurochrysis_carterae.AAC.3
MLTSNSRIERVIEEHGVQLVLVEGHNILEVALELEELGPAVVYELLGDSILGVVSHYVDDDDVRVDVARWCCCGTGCPTTFGRPYQDNVTGMPIYAQPKSVNCGSYRACCPLRSQLCARFPQMCITMLVRSRRSGVRNEVVPGLFWDALGALRCVASLYATNTAVQSAAVLQT